MLAAIVILCAVLLDAWMGQWIQIHPSDTVERWMRRLETILTVKGRILSVLVLILVAVPVLGVMGWMVGVPKTGLLLSGWGEIHGNGPLRPLPMHFGSFLFQMLVVWLALGGARLTSRAMALRDSLESGNYSQVARILDTFPLCKGIPPRCPDRLGAEVTSNGIAVILAGGCREVYAPLLWSALAGAPGAVAYRLVQAMTNSWDPAGMGWATTRLLALMEWLPIRLTALTYVLITSRARRNWHHWRRSSLPISLAAGVNALGLRLVMSSAQGNPDLVIGEGGEPPIPQDVLRAADLVQWGAWLWVVVVAWMGGMQVLVS